MFKTQSSSSQHIHKQLTSPTSAIHKEQRFCFLFFVQSPNSSKKSTSSSVRFSLQLILAYTPFYFVALGPAVFLTHQESKMMTQLAKIKGERYKHFLLVSFSVF
jgi:hypothetical protein